MFVHVRMSHPIDHQPRAVLAEPRRLAIVEMLRSGGSVTVAEIEARFGVSSMTARRDLAELERQGALRRTHGGAVLPAVSAHEDSFGRRIGLDVEAKRALAELAIGRVAAGESVFLDCSSTTFFLARRILDAGVEVTLLTNSLPIMDLVVAQARPNVELIAIGGRLRPLTQSFVGPQAVHAARAHIADRLFFSCKGLTADGTITDADPLEAELKRTMIAQAGTSTLLLDASKLTSRGLNAIAPLREIDDLVTHGIADAQLDALRSA
jgi:DeoR/GlpR family transcriptional regulator of sugar metabolism